MLPKSLITLTLFLLASNELQTVVARYQWLERDNRAVYLYPRRFGQEQPAVLQKLRDACSGEVCGTLAGKAVTPLLAAQPECSQQDLADEIIDASKQFDAETQANMIEIAKEYRQAEKNTPPGFDSNPPTKRNSVFCQVAPKNAELNGLVQAQDPENDPELFFDPATKATVRKGEQANTFPFGEAGAVTPAPEEAETPAETETSAEVPTQTALPAEEATECVTAVTVTITGTATASSSVATVTVGGEATSTSAAEQPAATAVGDADFGSCSVPQIEFGVGFGGRTETSFQPVDKDSFSQGSAQNIDIITRAVCDTLVNTCDANQAAIDLCDTAKAAASAAEVKTGAQADAFNAVFGIDTNFAAVQPIDDQGRPVGGAAETGDAPAETATATATASSEAPAATSTGSASAGDFGSCSTPEIKFAVGLDGRKETAFEPADKDSFDHGSAQNIDIITQFICDELTNSCDADDAAKALCEQASAAASDQVKGAGVQADAFNAVFGIQTNFADDAVIDNQGRVVSGGNAASQPNAPAAGNGSDENQDNQNQNNDNDNGNSDENQDSDNNDDGAAQGGNLQAFNEALGGVVAPTVTDLGGGRFQVEGNAAFNNIRSALVRSCDVQNNQCANAANSSGGTSDFSVGDCNAQQAQCISLADSA